MHTSSDTMAGAGGVRLAVTRWTPEVPAVAAVLLVHGYGEHSGRYEPVAQRLTAAGYAVTTFDLRGHGRSTGVARGTVDDFDLLVDDVATVARSVEGGGDLPLFVYGHSMGGLAVVRLAEKAAAGTVDVPPIAGLVVASAALVAAESIPAPLVAVANVIGKLAPKLPTIRLDGEAISRDPAVRSDYDADPLNYRGKLSAGTGRQMNLAMAAAMDRARTIKCPVLVIHGDADRLTAVVGSRRLAATLGSDDVTLREWPGAYHELHHEPERDEVLDTIVSWIGERVGRAD